MRNLILLPLALSAVPAAAQSYKSPEAARAVVRQYYDALERGRYADAYRLWGNGGQASGKSYTAFVRGFARTAHTRVLAGAPTDGDAGMGSVYITIPVEVRSTLKDGTAQRFRGSYFLRRVNDVDGATPAQLRWHIDRASLRAVPAR